MPALDQSDAAALLGAYDKDGFVVVPEAVDARTLGAIRGELAPYLDESRRLGRNDFEGFRTNRVYALLAKAPSVAVLVEHPTVLGLPAPAVSVSAIWAIEDFTADNGATEVIPGSHRRGDEPPSDDDARLVPVEMAAGSVVLFAGTLWHRGGANRTSRARLAITPQYCEPWARQQEQQILAVGRSATVFSERIRAMLGYSIHPPFMGHIDGLHPRRLLERGDESVQASDPAQA